MCAQPNVSAQSWAPAEKPGSVGRPRDSALDVAILVAARRHLVERGYTGMSIAEVAAEAGVSRPTVYRRWPNKFALTCAALDYGLEAQERKYARAGDPLDLPAREAFYEAVRRVDPRWANPHAVVLQGNIIGESLRAPELLALAADRAVNPRVRRLEEVLIALADRGCVRRDLDVRTIATMIFGAFFGAHLRGERDHRKLADRVASTVWDAIAR